MDIMHAIQNTTDHVCLISYVQKWKIGASWIYFLSLKVNGHFCDFILLFGRVAYQCKSN